VGAAFSRINPSANAADAFDWLNSPDGVIWLVGRIIARGEHFSKEIHLQGASLSEQRAVAMCIDETYFVAPLPVDILLPTKPIPWVGLYFPLRKPKEPQP
jgi:hypothetical protein